MRICYVDEAGTPGVLPSRTSPIEPVLVVTGLVVDQDRIPEITRDFLRLKHRFFPGLGPRKIHRWLDWMLIEVKGSEVRKDAAARSRRKYRPAFGFLDEIVSIMEQHEMCFFARIWVKGVGAPFKGRAVYASSVQAICTGFQRLLRAFDDTGFVIADNRTPPQNRYVSHSIFTQKLSLSGDSYDRLIEAPTFGDSRNHAGLQITDLLSSAILAPMAIHAYCEGEIRSLHVRPGYEKWKPRYGRRISHLGFRYRSDGRWRGGITVNDALRKRSAAYMLK